MQNNSSNKYDYIIAGAGCAGLSLLIHFISSGKFTDKKILLIDKSHKIENDRTWCFWETKPGLFQSIVCKEWKEVWFHHDEFSRLLDISPFRYKMIRGIDFYDHCFHIIEQQKNVEVLYGSLESVNHEEGFVVADGKPLYADWIFNSILLKPPELKSSEFYLLQHFKGWLIETTRAAFNEQQATLMDFRVSQKNGTSFFYVLPLSSTVAMVEYTLFSAAVLEPEEYDAGLRNYINQYIPVAYSIREEESGIIPMTNHVFSKGAGNVVNIGSAGGQTKPSSGYTFYFIQQHSRAITDAIIKTGKPFTGSLYSKKFRYYDSVLLNVLATGKLSGKKVFADMFRKNRHVDILQFLNNESSLATDLRIISSLPVIPFLRAGVREL